jgi:serine/threonine protein phosphatase PrpC
MPSPALSTFVQEKNFAARQYRGKRDNQEDYYAFADASESGDAALQKLLLVVGDGLGAHAGGSIASYIAVNAFVRAFHEKDGSHSWRLRAAMDTANETLGYISGRMPAVTTPMGTTMLAVLAAKDQMEWISVGDSPLFLYRKGRLVRMNADHSLTALLDERVKQGLITEDEAAHHPDRHTLQSALLGFPIALIDSPSEPVPLFSGDIIIAASDGILVLDHKALEELIGFGRNSSADKITEAILFAIRRINHERQDNVTIGIVKIP